MSDGGWVDLPQSITVRVGETFIAVPTGSDWLASNRARGRKENVDENLIGDLSSADGTKRVAATAEVFRRGKDVLPDLKKAGARQVAPFGGSVDGTRRLHVEKDTTEEDIQKICKTYQCTLIGKFTTEGRPSCYLQIGSGKSLEAVIQQILSTEPKVTTINLNGFEG